MSTINSRDELSERLNAHGMELSNEQLGWFNKAEKSGGGYLPFLTTGEYLDTALEADEPGRSAVLRQIIPDQKEFIQLEYELSDPLGEEKYSPFPRFVHRYPDRALLLVTDNCAMFCRHCFRRSFTGSRAGQLEDEQLLPMLEYLGRHREIKEVLFTGGDPLTLSSRRLEKLIESVKSVRPEMIIRICSRMPVVKPSRISDELVEMLGRFEGLWFITHFNHYAELGSGAVKALNLLRCGGIPVLNQTVLLRGVNDDVETLAELFQKLLARGVKPYYLFQGDLAAGTSHLRVPLDEALKLAAELKTKISGMAMPRFAVDLPGGGGKITLPAEYHHLERRGDFFTVKGFDNEEYRYPAD